MGTGFDIGVVTEQFVIQQMRPEYLKNLNGEVVDDVKQVFPASLGGIS